jgi:hypothetical protein
VTAPVGRAAYGPRRGELLHLSGGASRSALITGPSGSGKSALALGMMLKSLRDGEQVVLVDPKGELAANTLRYAACVCGDLRHDEVLHVEPAQGLGLPMNVLLEPLPADEVASGVRMALESAMGSAFGVQQAGVLHGLLMALAEAGGSILQVEDVLLHEEAREALGARVTSGRSRHFLTHLLPSVSPSRAFAIAGRISRLTESRMIAASLNASAPLRVDEILRKRLVVFNLGGLSGGQQAGATMLTRLLFGALARGVLRRRDTRRHLTLYIDEAQAVVGDLAGELEQLLQEARWREASLTLLTQGLEQLRSQELRAALRTNIGHAICLAPRRDELQFLADQLPRATGRAVDPERPDRLLTKAAEAAILRERLAQLPARYGIFVTFGRRSTVIRTADVPFERLDALAGRAHSLAGSGAFGLTQLETMGVAPLTSIPGATDRSSQSEPVQRRTQKVSRPPGRKRGRQYTSVELPE